MPKKKGYSPSAVSVKGYTGSGITGISNIHPVANPTKGSVVKSIAKKGKK